MHDGQMSSEVGLQMIHQKAQWGKTRQALGVREVGKRVSSRWTAVHTEKGTLAPVLSVSQGWDSSAYLTMAKGTQLQRSQDSMAGDGGS